jgi:uncharacterized membrane protein YcaP (DUF421 family)
MLYATMARERLLQAEVDAAAREHGLPAAEAADLVILETDGTISVVANVDAGAWSSHRLRSLAPDDAARP